MDNSAPKPKASPKDVFLHLLLIGTLYASIVSVTTLLFQYINRLFPDPISYNDYGIAQKIRWAVSVLIIVFAVFVWLTRLLEKQFRTDPAKHDLRIRKWLVHLTLFIAAITIIVDLITLLYNFLGGDLTTRFVLKIVAILLVALVVFTYYIWDLHRDAKTMPVKMQYLGRASILGAMLIIVVGFFLVGSPSAERARRFDTQRINDLQQIQYALTNHWQLTQTLPATVDELTKEPGYVNIPTDPETQAPYTYKRTDDMHYSLCATFTTNSSESLDPYTGPSKPITGETWDHPVGVHCFDRTINPVYNPPYPKMIPAVPVPRQ